MAWVNDRIRDLVVRTILGESDGTPDGMIAVAHVMKNRADSGAWGDRTNGGLTRVITAKKQFSMWNTDDPKLQALAARVNAIPASDPRYQRAAAIADGVFSEQIPDNTGGANHYHATTVSPDWAQGQKRQFIGGQYFYKLPLTASNTAGTAAISPSTVGQGSVSAPAPAPAPAPAATSITPIQMFTGGDYGRQATADKQPFSGIVIHVTGKPDLQSELAYNRTPDAGRGNAYYGYHYIVDRDGKVYQTAPDDVRTNHIMGNKEHGLSNENAIGVAFVGGAPAGKNPLPMTPEQMAAGKALVDQLKAKYNIDPTKIVGHGELDPSRIKGLNPDGGAEGAEFLTAYRGAPTAAPAAATPTPNPDAPAPQAQPVAATAPPGSPLTPGSSQNPPAGFVGPGSDKYSVIQRMPTGTGRNPELITAANWGNLFGGANPVTPPATASAAPAPAQPTPDLTQRVPLDQTPIPPIRPTPAPALALRNEPADRPSGVVNSLIANPPFPPPRPLNPSSIAPHWGSSTPVDADTIPASAPPYMPGSGLNGEPAMTRGGPSMGFPAMTNPFAALPGSMFASAQNLIKLLYPTG